MDATYVAYVVRNTVALENIAAVGSEPDVFVGNA